MVYAGRQDCRLYQASSITQNEAALAVVMGHEVSHAIFQHGNERMSQELAQRQLAVALYQSRLPISLQKHRICFLEPLESVPRLVCYFPFHENMNLKPTIGV